MVLLVFSTSSDALGQLHFGFECWDRFEDLRVRLGREAGHTPGWRSLWGRKWSKTSRRWEVRVMTRAREACWLWENQGVLEGVFVGTSTDGLADKGRSEPLWKS